LTHVKVLAIAGERPSGFRCTAGGGKKASKLGTHSLMAMTAADAMGRMKELLLSGASYGDQNVSDQ
jgi:hypothetical protein